MRDDLGMRRQLDQRAGLVEALLAGLVRVDAHRADRPRAGARRARCRPASRARLAAMCTMRSTPALAGARDHAGLVLGQARVVEVAMAVDDHAASGSTWRGNTPAGAGSAVPARRAPPRPSAAKSRSVPRHGEQIEQLGRGSGMNGWVSRARWRKGLGQDPEHGGHAGGVGLAQRPGRLGVDIAVGVAADLPDQLQGAMRARSRPSGAHASAAGRGRRRAAPGRRR